MITKADLLTAIAAAADDTPLYVVQRSGDGWSKLTVHYESAEEATDGEPGIFITMLPQQPRDEEDEE
jgi:hypothetical protein